MHAEFDMYSKQYTLCTLLQDKYLLLFSLNQTLSESLLRGTTRVSNSLDLDKDQRFVQNVFDVYYKSDKQFGSRSGLIFWQARPGFKLLSAAVTYLI